MTPAAQTPPACPAAVAAEAVARAAKGTGAELLARFPPRLVPSSWLATRAGRREVLARLLAPPFALDNPLSQQARRLGLITVLNWPAASKLEV